jgi:hypothetical protein
VPAPFSPRLRSLLSLAPGELQSARALQVLLYHDSTASRKLLETVARGDTDTLPARSARSILKRLGD